MAELVGCDVDDVWVASTGLIGTPPSIDKLPGAVAKAHAALHDDGWGDFAKAICTTDAFEKFASADLSGGHRLVGSAKGAGMIAPSMATMLAFFVSDVPLARATANRLVDAAMADSFNSVSVDGDRSTNDTLLFVCPEVADVDAEDSALVAELEQKLRKQMLHLATELVRDGEGSKHVITIEVKGARTPQEAAIAARAVGGSQLVKTAVYGNDPNWGRIAATVGACGVAVDVEKLKIDLCGTTVFEGGEPASFDAAALSKTMEGGEVAITIDLAVAFAHGAHRASDLGHEYVVINAEYHT